MIITIMIIAILLPPLLLLQLIIIVITIMIIIKCTRCLRRSRGYRLLNTAGGWGTLPEARCCVLLVETKP